MLNYGRQFIDEGDIESVVSVLQSDWLTQGPVVDKFELDLCRKMGSDYACAVSSGTAALHLTGLSLGWGEGDFIVTSPISFLASANCILYAGAIPVFVDVDPTTLNIEPNRLEEKIQELRSARKRIKAVVVVDFSGHPADWSAIQGIASRYELQLVNDNCHALGARYRSDPYYATKYADVTTLSFHPVKHITTGEGGAVITNDREIANRVRLLRTHGVTRDKNEFSGPYEPWRYEMVDLGFNYRITDIQCALGSSQLTKLDSFVKKRREVAEQYTLSLHETDSLICPIEKHWAAHAYHLYPIQLNFSKIGISRVDLFEKMEAAGIRLQVHYLPIHLQPYYQREFGFKYGDYPNAESYYEKAVSLPIHVGLTMDKVSYVIKSLKAACF